ncbi:amino acid adenylation domain-containing protein [Flavobacteriaceae bacterium M23B6Z8]
MNKQEYTGLEIAVVGMACKFPGAANIHEFWENLKKGKETISRFSDDELLANGLQEEDLANPNYVNAKGIIEGAEFFDAAFFGISPQEANILDPQLRVLLQCAYNALQDAGHDFEKTRNNTGVFVGASPSVNWQQQCFQTTGDLQSERFSTLIANDKDFISTKLSYLLNLHGHSHTIYTACSTSLVAVDMACQSLLTGKCDVTLAGGVSIALPVKSGYSVEEGMIMSKDGHTCSYDKDASGTIWSDGAGIVVLKRLEDAIAEGDDIYAVIKGSATNNDGNRKIGYTAPSIQGQCDVIRKAVQMAEVPLESIGYIEGHGSATLLGDKIEINALLEVFKDLPENYKCAIGSVKSNIGHLNVAAGIAGFIKGCLMIRHAQIPPSINFNTPNSQLTSADCSFMVNSELKEWENNTYPLRLGVSSFGIGGTNAHVILEKIEHTIATTIDERDTLICISAKTPAGVDQYANDLLQYVEKNKNIDIADIAYTLQTKRNHFKYRRAIVAKDRNDLIKKLSVVSGAREAKSNRVAVMSFPGMGGYYPTMSKDLYLKEPAFRKAMDECLYFIEKNTGKNCKPIILGEKNAEVLTAFHVPQLLVFSYEYSLAILLKSWGIEPETVLGYSLGEYVAACLSGVFDLETAQHLLSERGRLMSLSKDGKMIAVPLSANEAMPYLNKKVVIAVDNGQSVVLSGKNTYVDQVKKKFQNDDILVHDILEGPAAHSPEMNVLKENYEKTLLQHTLNPSNKPMLSNVTGDWCQTEYSSPTYWLRHLAEKVEFFKALKALVAKYPDAIFMELGVGNFINILLRRLENPESPLSLVNLVRSENQKSNDKSNLSDHSFILQAIGAFWEFGGSVDWSGYHQGHQRKKISLPDYPFAKVPFNIQVDAIGTTQNATLKRNRKLANWFYVPSWKRVPFNYQKDKNQERTILLFDHKSSDLLIEGLQRNHTVITVNYAEKYEKINNAEYLLDYNKKEQLVNLFEDLEALDKRINTILDITSIVNDEEQKSSLERNVAIVQSLQQTVFFHEDIEYLTVSCGLFNIYGTEILDAAKSTIISASRVIPQENPNITTRLIEIDKEAYIDNQPLLMEQLVKEVGAVDKVVSLRKNQRWVQYFESYPIRKNESDISGLKRGGTYIIIGGLGDVGYTISNAILENNDCNLIIVGRSEIKVKSSFDRTEESFANQDEKAKKIARFDRLHKKYKSVYAMQADAGSLDEMNVLVNEVKNKFGRLDGIVYAAGDVGGMTLELINNINAQGLNAHLSSKKTGLEVLRQVVAEHTVDFALVISSLSSLIGGIGMIGYAAMNQYVDTMVANENARGGATKWLSVNFPYLNKQQEGDLEENLALSEADQERLKFEALFAKNNDTANTAINYEESIQLFQRMFSSGNIEPQIAICPVNFPGLVEKLLNPAVAADDIEDQNTTVLKQRPVLDVPFVAPTTEMEQRLAKIWEDVLGFEVGLEDDFFQLGGDSLGVIRLVSNIQREFNISIEVKKVFKNTSFRNQLDLIKNGAQSKDVTIQKAPHKEYYVQSEAQKGFFVLNQMNPDLLSYNNLGILEQEGTIDYQEYEAIFIELIHTHDILRTSFHVINDKAVQKIHENVDFELELFEDSDQDLDAIIEKFHRPFNLEEPQLLRAAICKRGDKEYYILIDIHHIILDRLTFGMIMQDFESLHHKRSLSPANLKYVDFAEWQQSRAHEELSEESEAFWLDQFASIPDSLRLPTDHQRGEVQNFNASTVRFELSEKQHNSLLKICQEEKITMYTLMLSNYYILLSKLSNQEDIVVGTTLLGRPHKDLEQILGVFAHTLPIRCQTSKKQSFRAFLQEVKNTVFQCFSNEAYSFSKLVGKLDLTPDLYRNPLFDVMFEYYNFSEFKLDIPNATVRKMHMPNITTEFDFCMRVSARDNGRDVYDLDYRTDLYDRETIERFVTYFKGIIDATINDLDIELSDITFLPSEEKQLLIKEFNNTHLPYNDHKSIASLFEKQVTQNPEAIAAIYEGESLTYAELNIRANQVAHYLMSKGVVQGTTVGLLLHRSLDMIIGILGVLKAGGGYLPLDPSLPEQRIGYMLDKSRSSFLLTENEFVEQYSAYLPVKSIHVEAIRAQSVENPAIEILSENIAYCIFTSGSSGQPKGVVMNQKSVVNLVKGLEDRVYQEYNNKKLKVALVASFSFDASVQQIFGALLQGHSLYIVHDESRKDGQKLLNFYNANRIDVSDGTPTHLRLLISSLDQKNDLEYLSSWILAGETLSKDLVQQLVNHIGNKVQLYNFYGPTEACVDSTAYKIAYDRLNDMRTIPIGKPLPNERVYITDTKGNLVPLGVAGELCIAGDGLAQRYIGDQQMTSERFSTDHIEWEDRVYRTGDMARWLPDGNLEFIGREDDQIKLRGYRIELPEIEYQLTTHKKISNSVVLVKGKGEDDKQLVAYYQSKESISTSSLRSYLKDRLPDYMVPSFFIHMELFPLTVNGKIDRKSLPEHEIVRYEDYVSPTTKIERKLVALWADILKISPEIIGVESSFFDYGGDSLSMVFLKNSLFHEFAIKISLKDIISKPTIAHLARLINKGQAFEHKELKIPVVEKQDYYPLSPSQKRMYYLSQFDSDTIAYNMPQATVLKGALDKNRLEETFKKLIERHEVLRTSFEFIDGKVVQRVLPEVAFSIAYLESDDQIDAVIRNFIRPFDLSEAPLLRVGVVEKSVEESILIVDCHHIISDAITTNILKKDFKTLYDGEELEELRIQYKDYVCWFEEYARSEEMKAHKNYWLEQFAERPEMLELPYDYPNYNISDFTGDTVSCKLDKEKTKHLSHLAQEENTTLFVVLLSIYNILLSKLSNQTDIVIGSSVSGRNHSDLQNVAGIFINTLALRNCPSGDKMFRTFVNEVSETSFNAFEHQEYPFEELAQSIGATGALRSDALFNVMFEFFSMSDIPRSLADYVEESFDYTVGISKFDISLRISEVDGELEINLDYRTNLFKRETIEKWIVYFLQIIDSVLTKDNLAIRDLSLLTSEEVAKLASFNQTELSYERDASIVAIFKERVAEYPDRIALSFEGESLTYLELDTLSDRVAAFLLSEKVTSGSIVGLLFDRSLDVLISMLGVLKIGAAYLPIDTSLPEDRIRYMLMQSEASYVFGSKSNEMPFKDDIKHGVFDFSKLPEVTQLEEITIQATDAAYCIFTSGSTGRPKGVIMPHRGIINLVKGLEQNVYKSYKNKHLHVALVASFIFDASAQQIYGSLLQGHTLYITDDETRQDGHKLLEFYNRYHIDVSDGTPTHLGLLVNSVKEASSLESLSSWILAGEVLQKNLVDRFYSLFGESSQLYNFYGPTETCVDSTVFKVKQSDIEAYKSIPIGRPLPNERAYVVDEYGKQVPIGVYGELCIAGDGLALGYIGNPEDTAAKFRENWIAGEQRVYRTGDLVRWLPDGNLEYHRRRDSQVKLRGYRIELNEISRQMDTLEGVNRSLVMLKEKDQEQYLVGYYEGAESFLPEELRSHLSRTLPKYMIPNYFIHLDRFPVGPTGKVDMHSLPEFSVSSHENYVAPSNEIERQLITIWSDILNVNEEAIGVHTDFFDLGGNSLKASSLVNKIYEQFDLKINIKTIYQEGTVNMLSGIIENSRAFLATNNSYQKSDIKQTFEI